MRAQSLLKGSLCLFLILWGAPAQADSEDVDESHVAVLTDKNFDEALAASKATLVEFYAPWCEHCKAFRADYAKVAAEVATKYPSIVIAKFDVDANRDTAEKYEIEHLPTIKWFEGSKLITTYTAELNTAELLKWVDMVTLGASKKLKIADEVLKRSGVSVVAVFKPGTTEENDELRSAFRKLSISEHQTSFYHTEDPSIASALGLSADVASGGIAVFRNYPNHPSAMVRFAGHAAEGKDGSLLEKIQAFFHAEKLPDFIPYGDAIEDHGQLIMSVPIHSHMFIVAPKDKIESPEVENIVRAAANQLRGEVVLVTSDPHFADPDSGDQLVSQTFHFDADKTNYFVGVASTQDNKRYTCGVSHEEDLTVEKLVKCWRAIAGGYGSRIYASQPEPEEPLDNNNIRITVGNTVNTIAKDPTKDVLLEVYAPWCGACQGFAPIYARLAAAFAGVPSVVFAKLDGTENDHPDVEIEEFPTLLFYPAEKDAKPIHVPPTDFHDIAEFIKKHAKIPFTLPDLAAFENLEVSIEGFDEPDEEDGPLEGFDEDAHKEAHPYDHYFDQEEDQYHHHDEL